MLKSYVYAGACQTLLAIACLLSPQVKSYLNSMMARNSGSERISVIMENAVENDLNFRNFGFASTLILVPLFMMWLARYCERMTKRAVEKENAQRNAMQQQQKENNTVTTTVNASIVNQPTMAGFLNK